MTETLKQARAALAQEHRKQAARFDREARHAAEAAAWHREEAMRLEPKKTAEPDKGPQPTSPSECMCLVGHRDRKPHEGHTWWYTSSGGGHQLSSPDPDEKNLRQWWCPGIKEGAR